MYHVKSLAVQVGPAAVPTSAPRLDALELYARSKPELAAEAAAAAEAEADRSTESAGARDMIGLAAVVLPGHLAVPSVEQTCCSYVLSQALLTATSLHHSIEGRLSHVAVTVTDGINHVTCCQQATTYPPWEAGIARFDTPAH